MSVAGGGSVAAIVGDELSKLGLETTPRDVRYFLVGWSVARSPALEEDVRRAVRVFDWKPYRRSANVGKALRRLAADVELECARTGAPSRQRLREASARALREVERA